MKNRAPAMFVAASLVTCMGAALAGQPTATLTRTPINGVDFPAGYTTTVALAEMPAGCSGRHTHPGIDIGYVVAGDITVKIDGQPDLTVKVGQTFSTPANVVHEACSETGFKIMSTYVMERGKPLVTPVP